MKKTSLIVILCLGFVIVQGCRDTKKEIASEVIHEHEGEEVAMNNEFACPMGCEEGKTYAEKSTCPVCEMVLKKVEYVKSDDDELRENEHKEEHE